MRNEYTYLSGEGSSEDAMDHQKMKTVAVHEYKRKEGVERRAEEKMEV